ncbi:MAG: ABC transporter ATP-binding protein [Silicimonas sp.]|nr:ABC transporter ATP-binding protein [Silicimonas sp.]
MSFFSVENLTKKFGGLVANNNISMDVEKGEIRGVIGPNGAGKTTFFNLVSGFYRPTSGKVTFKGQTISGMATNKIARLGAVRTFQRPALFSDFTVLENVSIAQHLNTNASLLNAIIGHDNHREADSLERAIEIVDFLGMAEDRDTMANNLSHGLQRQLGVAMALATEPELLMLDEPVAGMNSGEKAVMVNMIQKIRDKWGVTVLLVEHDMRTVMNLCEKITVLDFGEKLAEGSPDDIRSNRAVIEAYLGADDSVT